MTDYARAIQFLSKELNFLGELGFASPTTSIEKSKLLGDSLLMIYVSDLLRRRIEVSYVAANDNRPAVMAIFLCNDAGERFSLEDWIKAKHNTSALQFVANQEVNEEQSFLDHFCLEFRFLVEGPLRGTVTGTEWDSISFDWKGYR